MSLRAVNIDWRKKFQWALEMESPTGAVNIAQILKTNWPKMEIEKSTIKQPGALNDVNANGRVKYDELKLERILLSNGPDLMLFNWFKSAADVIRGIALPGSQIKKNADLVHLDDAGNAIERLKMYGAWVRIIEGDDLEGSSDAWMEKATICFDAAARVPG